MDFLEEEIVEILNIFREESEEYIQKLNQNLLKLEEKPEDKNIIAELFREAHSLKGAARMIGLNDIQAVAHKIEDVFGLAKDKTILINSEIIDVLCQSVDCINSIIEECIASRGQSHSSNVDETILKLENVKELSKSNHLSKAPQNNRRQNDSSFHQTNKINISEACIKINELIPNVINALEQVKHFPVNIDVINVLFREISNLNANIPNDTALQEIKSLIEDIDGKLEGVTRGSGIMIETEIEEVQRSLQDVSNFAKNNCNLTNSLPDSVRQDLNDDESLVIDVHHIEVENDDCFKSEIAGFDNKFTEIANDLSFLSQDYPASRLNNLISNLEELTYLTVRENIKKIFEKIIEFVLYLQKEKIKLSPEIAEVVKQSFDTACSMIESPIDGNVDDPDLIVQRISILYQMVKLSENDNSSILNFEIDDKNIFRDENDDTFTNMEIYSSTSKNEMFPQILNSKIDSEENSKVNQNTTIKTIRVDTTKLDQLVNQVGELIIAKIKAKEHLSEVEKISSFVEDWYREWNKTKNLFKYMDRRPVKFSELAPGTSIYSQNKSVSTFFEETSLRLNNFMTKINHLHKMIQEDDTRLNLIVNELEEGIKSIRVLPLATIFHMFPRMTRDISRERNKEIELVITGSETSVDKKILEEIKSPLIHILRNAIDHGIEDLETRIQYGKNPVGKITISAYHLENSVLIEITDDGKGINVEAIKKKVLQQDLLTMAELHAMTDEQIMNIIFWPGFSTGEVITDISGRGIGLDIVYTKITQLNGKVHIKSTPGHGCKVSIQLPVTMATIKSFLVKVNDQTFAIPTNAIKTTVLIKKKDIIYKEGKETIIVNKKIIPICRLSWVLEMNHKKIDEEKMVVIVIEAEDVQVGFVVEKLLGAQEILHKNLTAPLLRVRNVAGVTTLGSGELCLILNINDIVKSAYYIFGMSKKEMILNQDVSSNNVPKNILVVDDSVTTRILERNILRAAGYNVTVAINGLDALTKIFSQEFDLIVTDVEMPEINGFELTERIRKDDRFRDIPIVLLTSLASEADKKRGLSLGADTYITKGYFDQEELIATVKKLLSLKKNQ